MSTRRKKILIIDDEEVIAFMLKDNFEQMGYEVIVATSGIEGIRKAENMQPDIITLDIMMQGLSGLEVLTRLKRNERTKNIAVILISIAVDDYRKDALRLGAVGFFSKPLDFNLLNEKLKLVTEKKVKSTILVVDDSEEVLKLIEMRLTLLGHKVVGASNGKEALLKAKIEKPDVILMDIVLPEKNGFEVIKELKHIPETADIPIIAISGYFSDMDDKEIVGVDKFLGKGFTGEELVKEIINIMKQR